MVRQAVAKIDDATADKRLASRISHLVRLANALFDWFSELYQKLTRHAPVAAAMDYILKGQAAFSVLLTDGSNCFVNNAEERSPHSMAFGRKA